MTPHHASHTIFIAPTSADFGTTWIALGLVRALQRQGISVGFAKPVGDPTPFPTPDGRPLDRSVHFARTLCGLTTPDPIPAVRAEEAIRAGNFDSVLEDIVALVEEARHGHEVVVVEGLLPSQDHPISSELDLAIARNLSASVVAVVAGRRVLDGSLDEAIADAAHRYGSVDRPLGGVVVARTVDSVPADHPTVAPVLAVVPDAPVQAGPRLVDIAADLGFTVTRRGDIERARVGEVVVAARGPEKLVESLHPGTLVVTPGDRSDLIVTSVFARAGGMPIAGLLLTCGAKMPAAIASFLEPRFGDLPILATDLETYDVAVRLSRLDRRVRIEDRERMERLIEHVADHLDPAAFAPLARLETAAAMTPPVFRHRLVETARAADRRIVLPEGDEPRTIRAAAICAEKRIARCVLLGAPARIRAVAATHGITLPAGLEIVDPEMIRPRYVAPMVELRRAKGLTAPQATAQLEDTVVLGTMMLAEGDVDGLVSGAVHTTANTVRPALQLIKTAPGSSIVSSVFFMLLPDQVLVYGDCAINPDPTATELAEIAIQSADSAIAFGIEPRIAMLSYSTGTSGTGDDVEKVREATRLVRERRPDLLVDGPMQYDAASVASVGRQKAPDSPVAGHANVFVFPDLNTGNTTYKAVQRSANVVSVGPMLQGLRKPVNDLSRGALVDDIVFTIALTAIQSTAAVPAAPGA